MPREKTVCPHGGSLRNRNVYLMLCRRRDPLRLLHLVHVASGAASQGKEHEVASCILCIDKWKKEGKRRAKSPSLSLLVIFGDHGRVVNNLVASVPKNNLVSHLNDRDRETKSCKRVLDDLFITSGVLPWYLSLPFGSGTAWWFIYAAPHHLLKTQSVGQEREH